MSGVPSSSVTTATGATGKSTLPSTIGGNTIPGRGNGRFGNTNRNNRSGKGGQGQQNRAPRNEGNKNGSSFRGAIKDMNGHVFQLHGEAVQKNQYSRTIDEIAGYIGLNFKKFPADIKKMVTTLTETKIVKPIALSSSADSIDKRIWENEVDMYATQIAAYKNNKCALYSLVWGQCSESMQAKVKSVSDYDRMMDENDSLALLKTIKGIAFQFESQDNLYRSLDAAKTAFWKAAQGSEESNAAYMTRFKNIIDVVEHYGGNLAGYDPALNAQQLRRIEKSPNAPTTDEVNAAAQAAKQKTFAMAFLIRACPKRYGLLINDISNAYARGTD